MTRYALEQLPPDLPEPLDDGACNHLLGKSLPDVSMDATNEQSVSLINLKGKVVIFCYPRTGKPGVPSAEGWDQIPGARGCTPQACSFRDHYRELSDLKVRVFGLSTQSTTYQKEAKERLHLPFELLSDDALHFTKRLHLPCFSVDGNTLIKRITLICVDGVIAKYFYPVFPPDKNIFDVLEWLQQN